MPFEIYTDDWFKFDSLDIIPIDLNTKATALIAVEMNLTDITDIGVQFPNLEILDIGCNNITILDLSNFHNLQILRCNKNKISFIIGFEYCNKLETVEMACNKLTYINSNHNVKILSIEDNLLKKLPDFNNLETLNVSHNKSLKTIGDYPKLTYLDISRTPITNLNMYMELKELICNNSQITKLEPYPNLEILEIVNCPLKKKDLPDLQSIKKIYNKYF